jgi:hypothetical protein
MVSPRINRDARDRVDAKGGAGLPKGSTTGFRPEGNDRPRGARHRVGLDYFGIDCSLDRDGDVVIFEVNASMLIHPHRESVQTVKSSASVVIKDVGRRNTPFLP